MQYYTDSNAEWVSLNGPDIENEEMYRWWWLHATRLYARNLIKELREDLTNILQKIIKKDTHVSDVQINWEEWYPVISFKYRDTDMTAAIREDIGYEICTEGTGIFIDLLNKKVGYNSKLGDYDCIYNTFNYENIAELYLAMRLMSRNCKGASNIDSCRRQLIEEIRKELRFKGIGRA